MRSPDRLIQLAREAGAYERERLPTVEPPRRESLIFSATDQENARQQLILQRTGSTYYKDPSKQKRNVFRSDKKKAALNDTTGWTFTKAECFAVLDQHIRDGAQVGLIHAALTATADDPLDINNTYASDENGKVVATGRPNGWLELVAERNEVNHVRLLCTAGANQQSKDQALGKSLQKQAYKAAQELLRHNADPNVAASGFFMFAVEEQNTALINMFLTSTIPLDHHHINEAMLATVGRGTPNLLGLLFAHGAHGEYADGHALVKAAAGQHLNDFATILFYSDGGLSGETIEKTVVEVASNGAEAVQHRMFELLLCAGAHPNSHTLLDQLMNAVENDRRALVQLLIAHQTSPDQNDAACLRRAIALQRMEVISILLQGHLSTNSASIALDQAGELEDLQQYEYVVTALLEKGVSRDALHKCLADAVEKGCDASFAQILISYGANIDHANAQCICTAIVRHDFRLLRVLLQGQSNAEILGQTLSEAMNIQSRSERFDVMNALLDKGVSGTELHVALQKAVGSKHQDSDYQLMDLLIRKNASVNFLSENGNCVSTAMSNGNERALDMLMEGGPNKDTVSAALGLVRTSFAESEASDYERTARMIETLLEHGAYGQSADRMLVEAVKSDYRGKVLDLLLKHKASANHEGGEAIKEALRLDTMIPLEKLCQCANIEKATFAKQIPNSLEEKQYQLPKATLLCQTASRQGHKDVLDQPLLDEARLKLPRIDVIELLLRLGASVDYDNGEALQHVVGKGDVRTSRSLLTAKPSTITVARAFPRTMQISDLPTRYDLMQLLLQSGGPGMGDEALVQAAQEANPNDLSHVELLLQHNASPDFNKGAPVLEAVKARNLPLINMLLNVKPNETTLANAFNLARQIQCPREERDQMFTSLLNTGCRRFDTSTALIEVVERIPGDVETSMLLLKHGASVDAQNGQAMQHTAVAGSLELLKIFLLQSPRQQSRDATFHAAMRSALEITMRREVYLMLLESGISRDLINTALFEVTRQGAVDDSLCVLLIDFGASLDAHAGAALDNVTAIGDPALLKTMLRAIVNQQDTLDKSFATCMQLKGRIPRQDMAKQLLGREPGVSNTTISHFLAHVVREKDEELLDLMAGYRPDASYNGGEGLVTAAQEGNEVLTAILTRTELPASICDKAFEAMLDKHAIRSSPGGMHTASILLKLGINQTLLDRALLDGFSDPVDQHTKDLVELLTPYRPDFNVGNGKAFVAASSARELELFRYMAFQNPNPNIVIPALIVSFAAITDTQEDAQAQEEDGKVNGFEHGRQTESAPVNDIGSAASQTADEAPQDKTQEMSNGDVMTIQHMRSENEIDEEYVNREAMLDEEAMVDGEQLDEADAINDYENEQYYALPTAEERLVGYLLNLDDCLSEKDMVLEDSIMFTAMKSFPKGTLLIDHLLDHGCPANSKIESLIDPSGKTLRHGVAEEEQMTGVMWALTCEEPVIDEAVIMEILKRGRDAGVDFRTSVTHQTAAILASAADRCTVLERVIEIGIDPSQCNTYDHSALFYASRNGHLNALHILHAAGAKVNDGSLHEAAREGHYENVEFLLSTGHRPDFPSAVHADGQSGRTPLEELCLNSAPSSEDLDIWNERTGKCIKQLLPKTVNDVPKSDGKTMLHLAIQNRTPVPVTRAILDFTTVWENINHPTYLFRDENGYHYSPTKYVELLCPDIDGSTKTQLISLLHHRKCTDRFYAHTVDQPTGAVGLPEEIAKAVEKEQRAQFDHRENMKRQEELLARRRALDAEDHQRRVTNDRDRHNTLTKQQRDREESERQATQRKQAADQAHNKQMQQQRAAAAMEESNIRLRAMDDEASRRNQIRSKQQAAEISHQRTMAHEELSSLRDKLELEQQMAAERDRAARNEASIIRGVLEERKATARYEREQRQAAARYD